MTDNAPFTTALANAIEASGITQKAWAQRIGASEASVSNWLSGKHAPPPSALYMLVKMLRDIPRASAKLRALEEVLDAPASRVTPHDRRMHPTPGHYMLTPLKEQFLSALASLSTNAQEQMLLRGIETMAAPKTTDAGADLHAVESAPIRAVAERVFLSGSYGFGKSTIARVLRSFYLAACDVPAIRKRLAVGPRAPREALAALWNLGGCAEYARAVEQSAADPVLLKLALEANEGVDITERLTAHALQLCRQYAPAYGAESDADLALERCVERRFVVLVATHLESDESVVLDPEGATHELRRYWQRESGARVLLLATPEQAAVWVQRRPSADAVLARMSESRAAVLDSAWEAVSRLDREKSNVRSRHSSRVHSTTRYAGVDPEIGADFVRDVIDRTGAIPIEPLSGACVEVMLKTCSMAWGTPSDS